MRNGLIWCVVFLAMAGTAFSETKEPPKKLAVDLGGGVKMEMVLIPAGEFKMGSGESAEATAAFFKKNYGMDFLEADSFKDEHPQHRVRITKPFYLGKYEVTQEQWEAVMGNNLSRFKGPKNPVEMVSWDDCQDFLVKLNAKSGGQGGKFVLPTEAQWEYACRAGNAGKFCFGDDEKQLGEYAWYYTNSDDKSHAVGGKKPNAFGLCDMHGNVWEWCQDWYGKEYYAKSPVDNPTGPDSGDVRVLRGGSWYDWPFFSRSAKRIRDRPDYRDYYAGFRVARTQ
jgi:formylglycine-generating enzyme required for sulfatase activity